MGRLTYQTLRENVVDVIRMKILNHELVPGMRIIEQDISDELGVSRGPIREALRQLEQEGLVAVSYTHLDVYKRQVRKSLLRI